MINNLAKELLMKIGLSAKAGKSTFWIILINVHCLFSNKTLNKPLTHRVLSFQTSNAAVTSCSTEHNVEQTSLFSHFFFYLTVIYIYTTTYQENL